jgi:hypothetical protein
VGAWVGTRSAKAAEREVLVVGRRFIVQVSGRHEPRDFVGHEQDSDLIHVTTVLRATVRDQSALQGLLRRAHDLGLSLVELHEAGRPDGPVPAEREYRLTVEGPLGEITESALVDFIGPIQVSTRYSFADPLPMSAVLTRLLDRGAELEHAGDQEESAEGASARS